MNTDLINQFIDSIPTEDLERILKERMKGKPERKIKKLSRKQAFLFEIQKEMKKKMYFHGKR